MNQFQMPFFGNTITIEAESPKAMVDEVAEWSSMKGKIIMLHDSQYRDRDEVDDGIRGSFVVRQAPDKKGKKTYTYYEFYSETLGARINLSQTEGGIGFYVAAPGTKPMEDGKGGFRGFTNIRFDRRDEIAGVQEELQELLDFLNDNVDKTEMKLLKSEMQRLGIGDEKREQWLHSHSIEMHFKRLFSTRLREAGFYNDDDDED